LGKIPSKLRHLQAIFGQENGSFNFSAQPGQLLCF